MFTTPRTRILVNKRPCGCSKQNNVIYSLYLCETEQTRSHLGSCISRTDVKAQSNLMMLNHCVFTKHNHQHQRSIYKLWTAIATRGWRKKYHLEATLTINITFPLNLFKETSFPSMSCLPKKKLNFQILRSMYSIDVANLDVIIRIVRWNT